MRLTVTGPRISSTASPVVDLPPQQRDVVELLLEAHIEARQVVCMAESLSSGSATCGARETATTIADHVEWMLPLHCDDEDQSVAPRLMGRHPVVDDALGKMKRQHLSLEAPMARVRMLCMILNQVLRFVQQSILCIQMQG